MAQPDHRAAEINQRSGEQRKHVCCLQFSSVVGVVTWKTQQRCKVGCKIVPPVCVWLKNVFAAQTLHICQFSLFGMGGGWWLKVQGGQYSQTSSASPSLNELAQWNSLSTQAWSSADSCLLHTTSADISLDELEDFFSCDVIDWNQSMTFAGE